MYAMRNMSALLGSRVRRLYLLFADLELYTIFSEYVPIPQLCKCNIATKNSKGGLQI